MRKNKILLLFFGLIFFVSTFYFSVHAYTDKSSRVDYPLMEDISVNIAKLIDLPVCLWDERLSTVGAFNLSSQLDVNISKRERDIDKNAAAFILQGAIDYLNN